MDDRPEDHPSAHRGFIAFAVKRLLLTLVVIAVVLYGLSIGLKFFKSAGTRAKTPTQAALLEPVRPAPSAPEHGAPAPPGTTGQGALTAAAQQGTAAPAEQPGASAHTPAPAPAPLQPPQSGHAAVPAPQSGHAAALSSPSLLPVGVAFVDAVIKPLRYELYERLWGWRSNDILDVTDNVNNFQLGVLEATRRTVVALAERISRTGYNDTFDHDVENAMNNLMVKATSYWFPTPESKYKDSLSELDSYKRRLSTKEAFFYNRADNLIPLLSAYEELLGSCDENLVKTKEADGSKVRFSKTDDYFYYAKGVSSVMASVLEAVSADFATVLSNRNGADLLHHAIVSCRLASSLEPWIVFNGDLDGILANHRANMAAPISHARFYLGQLIRTLTT